MLTERSNSRWKMTYLFIHVITATFYSIKWVHEMNNYLFNLSDLTSNGWVKTFMEAGTRLSSIPIKRKEINTDMLISLCYLFCETNDI